MSLMEPTHTAGPLRPIPIHLPQPLAPRQPHPVMLDGLRFPPYRLGSLLPLGTQPLALPPTARDGVASDDVTSAATCSSLGQPCQPPRKDNPSRTTSRPAKPLWNPALDLTTATSTHDSPKKGDTAESLPMVTSNLDLETAKTLTPCSGDARHSTDTDKRGGNPEALQPTQPGQHAAQEWSNKPPSRHQPEEEEAPGDRSPEMSSRKRKEPASPRCASPEHSTLTQIPGNLGCGKLGRVAAPSVNFDKASPPQAHPPPLEPLTDDMRFVGGITTDSHAYQHFHHQRRLALLASNLLHMGSQRHHNLLSHHAHLLPPQLQHYQQHNRPVPPAAAVPHHPGLSLHNALALAQSREVLERLSAFPSTTSACGQHRRPHSSQDRPLHTSKEQVPSDQHNHQQQLNLQEPKPSRKDNHPANSHLISSSPLSTPTLLTSHSKAEKLHPPHPLTLQHALVLAQTRALVNAGPILPHGLLPGPNQPHLPHPQPGMVSPLGGNAPVGAAAGLGMGVSVGGAGAGGSYGRKLFPCPQCRYTTDRRNNLKRHMLTMHQTSSKMLECCGILFSTKASLREHAMIFHYHGYTCYFCGRRFCRKALLKRHLSVHNGQKDFVCTVCDYATSHKSNLERHRKVHSRQEGEEEDNHGDFRPRYHDDMKSNGSEPVSHDDVSDDELSVCSDFEDDIDVEIDVNSD